MNPIYFKSFHVFLPQLPNAACPPRMFYFAFKADLKARKECNNFKKYYQCKAFCERCDAVQHTKDQPELYSYKNMNPSAPYAATVINHDQYIAATRDPSPWINVEGWQLETVTFDFMHVVYLGIARNLIPSCLKMLQLQGYGYEPGETDDMFLKRISVEMRETCKSQKCLICSN